MSVLSDANKVGSFTCPHPDGEYTLTVYDLRHWATGSCLIRQEGQGQKHDIALTAGECDKLSEILTRFSDRYS
jgi:hypothetical protein